MYLAPCKSMDAELCLRKEDCLMSLASQKLYIPFECFTLLCVNIKVTYRISLVSNLTLSMTGILKMQEFIFAVKHRKA